MEFTDALNGFLAAAQKKVDADYARYSYPGASAVLSIQEGPRFIRVVKTEHLSMSGSAYCFIEKATGNVLKSAGWKAPAKGVRSNIFAADFGASGITAYGAVYNR